ncbi:MAG: AI-2E family transporter [Bacillota bacterium]|nr:AI-2E family transporter [Bacillota bacterium]
MWNSRLFKTGIGVLLLFLIIYIGSQITFIFYPFVVAFEALFISFLVAGILFYFTYPFVDWLNNHKIPRSVAIIIVFLIIVGLLALLGVIIGPILQSEFTKLTVSIPEKIREARLLIQRFEGNELVTRFFDLESLDTLNLENLANRAAALVSSTFSQLASSVTIALDFLTNIFMTVIIIPFLLYYMLKEKEQGLITGAVDYLTPLDYVDDVKSALAEMNKSLSTYVQGLAIVCLCVGILSYIGFLIIGLDYALLLSIFIMIFNIVPWLGPFIGAIPAVIVGLIESPLMMLEVLIIIVIVQQVEGLLISPQVMGRKLSLSPLAIILIVLVAGRLGGLLGIILAIPVFTILKIIASHIYEHYKKKRSSIKSS